MGRTWLSALTLLAMACGGTADSDSDASTVADAVVAADAASGDPTLTVVLGSTGSGTVVSSPAGIDCGTDCDQAFASGTLVNLTATPDGSSTFGGWSGGCSGTAATCSVNLDSDVTVTANFDKVRKSLQITKLGSGTGTVTSTPAGIDCGVACGTMFAIDQSISLTATPDSNSRFIGWSVPTCTGTGDCTFTFTDDLTVTATFEPRCLAAPTVVMNTGQQSVTVPDNCAAAVVKVWGAGGGRAGGGGGGFATAKVPVTPAESLTVWVGQGGVEGTSGQGGGGGGGSAVLRASTPLVVAGGGGGQGGACCAGPGGPGGGTVGLDGTKGDLGPVGMGGTGGTQAAAGTGGVAHNVGSTPSTMSSPGANGAGINGGAGGNNAPGGSGDGAAGGIGYGAGGNGGSFSSNGGAGGGGGGGFFGAGGGGGSRSASSGGAGGGGGSSYTAAAGNTMQMTMAGSGTTPGGNTDQNYVSGVGVGGVTGGNGMVVIIWVDE